MADLLHYRASNSAIYYTPQKRVAVGRTIVGSLIAAVLIVVGSFLYVWVLPKFSSPPLRLAAVGCAALAVGLLALIPVRMGRVAIAWVAGVIGALLSLLALWVMWVAWIHGHLERMGVLFPYGLLIKHPVLLWRIIEQVEQMGAWRYGGDLVRGLPLAVLWICEAGLVLGAGVLIPIKGVFSGDPVCRECGKICVRTPKLPRFAEDRQSEFVGAIEARQFGELGTHRPPRNADAPELTLRLMRCRGCGQTNVLTVTRVAWEFASGKRKVVAKPLINQMLITPAEAEELVGVCAEIAEQRAAPVAVEVPEAQPPNGGSREAGEVAE